MNLSLICQALPRHLILSRFPSNPTASWLQKKASFFDPTVSRNHVFSTKNIRPISTSKTIDPKQLDEYFQLIGLRAGKEKEPSPSDLDPCWSMIESCISNLKENRNVNTTCHSKLVLREDRANKTANLIFYTQKINKENGSIIVVYLPCFEPLIKEHSVLEIITAILKERNITIPFPLTSLPQIVPILSGINKHFKFLVIYDDLDLLYTEETSQEAFQTALNLLRLIPTSTSGRCSLIATGLPILNTMLFEPENLKDPLKNKCAEPMNDSKISLGDLFSHKALWDAYPEKRPY